MLQFFPFSTWLRTPTADVLEALGGPPSIPRGAPCHGLTFLGCSGGALLLGWSRCCSADRHHTRFNLHGTHASTPTRPHTTGVRGRAPVRKNAATSRPSHLPRPKSRERGRVGLNPAARRAWNHFLSRFRTSARSPAASLGRGGEREREREGGKFDNFAILSVRLHNDGVAQGR